MRKLFAWLGIAALAVIASPESARAGEPLKPYVVFVLDTSGSMRIATGSGPPSCGGTDTRLNHARCAIRRIVNSYGDMVFALGRFRMNDNGTTTTNTFPTGCTSTGAGASGSATCNTNGDMFQLLTPLIDGNNDAADAWVNLTGNVCRAGTCSVATTTACQFDSDCPVAQTCVTTNADPEIFQAAGNTPIEGSLNGSKLYWQGTPSSTNFTVWPNNLAGFAPITNDPTNTAFLPKPNKPATCNPNPTTCNAAANCVDATNCCCLEQCRPYITVMLTDGDETCGGNASAANTGADALLRTDVNNRRYRVETRPIGFGISPGDTDIENLAHAGGVTDAPGVNEGFYASNETDLQLAISSILDDAIKTEACNGRDDDCDILIDEDFEPAKNEACDNGAVGVCRRTGTLVCRSDETGLTCNAEQRTCVNNQLFINSVGQGANTCGETCNNLDDDCDGKIDENLVGCSCSPQQEQCNGRDDDCDTRIDEASTNGPKLARPCGTGTCAGVETCNFVQNCGPLPGSPGCDGFGGCTAQTPVTETCNGLDDNCDGIKDGLQADCSTMSPLPPENFGVDDPRNNPGHPSNNPIPENICNPGFKVCPVVAGAPNSFGSCQNEVKPCNGATNNTPDSCTDGCNGRDDDCDNVIDEDFQPADCSNGCGVGTTVCTAGVLDCSSTAEPPGNDGCDGVDDDCDTKIDEDFTCTDTTPKPGFPATCNPKPFTCDATPTCTGNNCCCACSCTNSTTCSGTESCLSGAVVCQGEPISQESCDCSDNNCNGATDEGNLCAPGSVCSQFCQCAFTCSNSEFPCPLGKFCKTETAACSPAVGCDASDACTQDPNRTDCCCRSLCITDPCFGITCPAVGGNKQVCQVNEAGNQGSCVDACSVTDCGVSLICIPETGECKPDDCTTFPDRCTDSQTCIAGTCVTNLCKDVVCPTDQYCAGGNCIESCADIECPSGQRCRLGVCEADPCGAPCAFGLACNDNTGECVTDGCSTLDCPAGQYCNPNNNGGVCENDLCVGTACPSPDQICRGGTCYDPADFAPDGGVEVRVTTGGGGCRTGGGDAGLLVLGIALLFVRRRGARS